MIAQGSPFFSETASELRKKLDESENLMKDLLESASKSQQRNAPTEPLQKLIKTQKTGLFVTDKKEMVAKLDKTINDYIGEGLTQKIEELEAAG